MRLIETYLIRTPKPKLRLLEGVRSGELPQVIYSTIRAINANKVTRNRTRYVETSLRGDPQKGTGLISFTYPYPIPILRDHLSHPSMFSGQPAALPYGRVASPAEFVQSANYGYVQVIASIWDPFAIDMILTERFLTVSIGCEADEVLCSICGDNIADEDNSCTHEKGTLYEGIECIWDVGPIRMREISFVNVPSDDAAMVIKAHDKQVGGEAAQPDKSKPDIIIRPNDKPFSADWPDTDITKPIGRPYWMPRKKDRPDPDDDVWGDKEAFSMDVAVLNEACEFVNIKTGAAIRGSVVPRKKVIALVESLPSYRNKELGALASSKERPTMTKTKELEAKASSDEILTEGDLYSLPLDHPDYGMEDTVPKSASEAPLTYKRRQGLPDSAFCYVRTVGGKKVRKFPASDASHVRNGLARLPQSNLSPADKSKVHACLARRAKRYGIKVGGKEGGKPKVSNLITLVHKELAWSLPLYEYEETKEGVQEAYKSILQDELWTASPFMAEITARALASAIKVAGEKAKALKLLDLGDTYKEDLEPKDEPLVIEITDETYPLLINLVDRQSQVPRYSEEEAEHTEEYFPELPIQGLSEETDWLLIEEVVRQALNDKYWPPNENGEHDYSKPWPSLFALYNEYCICRFDGKYIRHTYVVQNDAAVLDDGTEVEITWTVVGANPPETPAVEPPPKEDEGEPKGEPKADFVSLVKPTLQASKHLADELATIKRELHVAKARELAILKKFGAKSEEPLEDLVAKYSKRTLESLQDAIADVETELNPNTESQKVDAAKPDNVDLSSVQIVNSPVGTAVDEDPAHTEIVDTGSSDEDGKKATAPDAKQLEQSLFDSIEVEDDTEDEDEAFLIFPRPPKAGSA